MFSVGFCALAAKGSIYCIFIRRLHLKFWRDVWPHIFGCVLNVGIVTGPLNGLMAISGSIWSFFLVFLFCVLRSNNSLKVWQLIYRTGEKLLKSQPVLFNNCCSLINALYWHLYMLFLYCFVLHSTLINAHVYMHISSPILTWFRSYS